MVRSRYAGHAQRLEVGVVLLGGLADLEVQHGDGSACCGRVALRAEHPEHSELSWAHVFLLCASEDEAI